MLSNRSFASSRITHMPVPVSLISWISDIRKSRRDDWCWSLERIPALPTVRWAKNRSICLSGCPQIPNTTFFIKWFYFVSFIPNFYLCSTKELNLHDFLLLILSSKKICKSYFPVKYLYRRKQVLILFPGIFGKDRRYWRRSLSGCPSYRWFDQSLLSSFDVPNHSVVLRIPCGFFNPKVNVAMKIWPCHGSKFSAVTTNFPSPCDTEWISPCTPANHGELLAIRVSCLSHVLVGVIVEKGLG